MYVFAGWQIGDKVYDKTSGMEIGEIVEIIKDRIVKLNERLEIVKSI